MVVTPDPSDVPSHAGARQVFANVSPRTVGRITSTGLSLVLIFLAAFAVLSAITTRNAAAQVKQATEMSDLYQQARFAVAAEELLERKYRLEPSPEVAVKYRTAADTLVTALETVSARGDAAEQAYVAKVFSMHRDYLNAIQRMFVAVDAGNTALVLEIDGNEVDPAFDAIETLVDQAAEAHREQALQRLSELDQTEALVFTTTPIVFAVGLILLAFFWSVLRSFQRRLDLAGRQATQREIERVKSIVERDAAREANRAKSTFLATMSHELRTPLSGILGYSELLQMRAQHLGYQELIEDIEKIWMSGKHLLALINDVLDLSKIEAGKMQLFIEPLEIGELLDDVVATTQTLVAKNLNNLALEVPENLGSMHTDVTKIRQVLINLLSNAAKFTQHGTIVLRVEQEQGPDGQWIRFIVRDTGIGISAEQLQRLFQPFTQADASTTRKYGGTGLGLALSKQLCEHLGGSITVESTPGVGSIFTVSLPAFTEDQSTSATVARPEMDPEEANMFESDVEFTTTATVLVIDDDPQTREIITRHLVAQGMSVECAASGIEGLHLARALLPSAITLDIVMPEMDGWDVLTECKADPLLAEIPVIMVSIIDEKTKGFALGVADYLVKPVEHDRLIRLIQQHSRPAHPNFMPHDRSILVVEDDVNLRTMLRRVLSGAGWDVVEAPTGQAALDWVSSNTPALIILDLMLPELDGIQVIERLQAMQNGQSTPIVVVTAKDLTPAERARLNGSIAQILQKGDYHLEDLLATVYDLVMGQLQMQSLESQEATDD